MMNHQPAAKTARFAPGWVALLLFWLAIIPRLPGLDRFIITDEHTNIFIAGSDVLRAFLTGNFRGTYWHFYPGVTMSWLTDLGLVAQYGFELALGRPLPPLLDFIYGDILAHLVAARLPFALLSAAAVPAIYLLARKLLPNRVALLGALFIAFDPFFLAHSRVNHGDAPVAVFMAVSMLALLVLVTQPVPGPASLGGYLAAMLKNPWLLLSAVMGGLAALTKAPGHFMAVFVVILSLGLAAAQLWRGWQPPRLVVARWLAVIVAWGVVSLAVFVLLWPSMWVDPVGTLRQMLNETFGKVEAGHLVYFMGQATLNPGLWFYLVVIPFRLTPVALPGVALSLLGFVPKTHSRSDEAAFTDDRSRWFSPLFLLWFFTVTLLLFGDISPKKQDRYLLPLFPVLDLLAAVGWVGLAELALAGLKLPAAKIRWGSALAAGGLVLLHAAPVVTYYPYYLTYFNPLLGGPARAFDVTLMGWGEGMEQVAAYLNTRPNADQLYVAATPSQTLLPFFVGRGENFYTNDIALRADYVVLYVSQLQRLAPSPEIVRYYQAQSPEMEITIQGVPYAKIYRNTRRILADIPPTATPVNLGLADKIRLAGYAITPNQPEITLYWHALAPLAEDYTVSVRGYTAAGERLAQQDQWPVNGLLPTRQWRQGDYVADAHRLDIPAERARDLATFEIVVYNAATGQPLGAPIKIAHE